MSTPISPDRIQHVAPVPGSDVEAQIETLADANRDTADTLASIRRGLTVGIVASTVMAGAAAVAAVALVIGEVRR